MTPFSPELFLSTLALIGAVIVISALLSGLVEKTGLPQVAVFLGLGAAIGPAGLNLIDVRSAFADSPGRGDAQPGSGAVHRCGFSQLVRGPQTSIVVVSWCRPGDALFRAVDRDVLLVAAGTVHRPQP